MIGDNIDKKSLFITFEGCDGAGKSSQINALKNKIQKLHYDLVLTREPGGTAGAEAIRHVILSGNAESLGAEMEAMLFAAARSDHVDRVIRPALRAGKIVLCDRFFDSTRVYQGASGKVDMGFLHALERIACDDVWPDLTLILDLAPEEGIKRANSRRKDEDIPDRFEKEDMAAQQLRRDAFREIAENEPERCRLIDASGTEKEVAARIWKAVKPMLESLEANDRKAANDR